MRAWESLRQIRKGFLIPFLLLRFWVFRRSGYALQTRRVESGAGEGCKSSLASCLVPVVLIEIHLNRAFTLFGLLELTPIQ